MRVALLVLASPLLAGAVYLGSRWLQSGSSKHGLVALALLGLVTAIALLTRGRPARQKQATALLASTWFGLLAVEALLTAVSPPPLRDALLAKGLPYDTRSLGAYIADCEAEGRTCRPVLMSRDFFRRHLSLDVEGTPTVPLAGLADTDTVLCNEWGEYVEFRSDTHGFNNPPDVWTTPKPSTIVAGDSFAVGYCVPAADQLVAQLGRALGTPTVNLGMAGNGPLSELAGLREYLPLLQPRRVVWVYYEGNDLSDLALELEHPVLSRYLEPDFRQGLVGRRAAVQAAIGTWISERGGSALTGVDDKGPSAAWRFLTLTRTRTALANVPKAFATPKVDTLRRALELAREEAHEADATFHFVYLPRYECLLAGPDACAGERDAVLGLARDLDLDALDLGPALRAVDDVATLFPAGLPGHFNAEGYRLVAEAIASHLRSAP